VGVPLGWVLCFKTGLGVFGLWWALAIGLGILSLIYVRVWFGVDWDEEVAKVSREGGGQAMGEKLIGEHAVDYHSIN
jgi:MATE family multidrug resistance protein